jgi:adenylylsulfate kinase
MIEKQKNIKAVPSSLSQRDRETLNGHRSLLIWFTGLSGSGKSTLSYCLEQLLFDKGVRAYVLDGDNLRYGLCSDLTFSSDARTENIRRVGEVSKLFVDAGIVVIASFISPIRADRERVRSLLAPQNFVEIFCSCSLENCEMRDVKGLYKKARNGLIPEFTGISSGYEVPENPELTLDTSVLSVEECLNSILVVLRQKGLPV